MEFLDLPKLSLLRMSLIRMASHMWLIKDPHITSLVAIESRDACLRKEIQVINSVKAISLPESVKNALLFILVPIGIELKNWWIKMSNLSLVRPTLLSARLSRLPWTLDGTIDEELASLRLVQDPELSLVEKFRVACEFCLEDQIVLLWPLVRNNYVTTGRSVAETFWTNNLEGKVYPPYKSFRMLAENEENPMSLYNYLFTYVLIDNLEARKYLWGKLTDSERNQQIESWIEDSPQYEETAAKLLQFIYRQMNPDQKERFRSKFPMTSLRCFMTWPNYDLFLSMVIGKSHSRNDYFIILDTLVKTAKWNANDVSYHHLFHRCWKDVDFTTRSDLLKESYLFRTIVAQLFRALPENCVKLMVNDLGLMDEQIRGAIVLGADGIGLCQTFVSRPELLESLLDFCVTNETVARQFVTDMKRFLNSQDLFVFRDKVFPYLIRRFGNIGI